MADWERTGHDRGGRANEPDTGPMIDHVVPIAPADGPMDFPDATPVAGSGDVGAFDIADGEAPRHHEAAFWLVPDDRPAPPSPRGADPWIAVLIVCSLTAHIALAALFDDEPEPLPSIGVVSLSVELVAGADLAPSIAGAPSRIETAESAASPGNGARPEAASWVEQMAAFQAVAPQAERPPPVASQPKPDDEKAAVIASVAADSSIGRGASTADATYPGIVAARLARFKQYPADARKRGQQGNATITFTLDGDGSVTQVELAQKTGIASLDRESLAMVRRAAPFPPTPTGGPMSFTVPVNFSLR